TSLSSDLLYGYVQISRQTDPIPHPYTHLICHAELAFVHLTLLTKSITPLSNNYITHSQQETSTLLTNAYFLFHLIYYTTFCNEYLLFYVRVCLYKSIHKNLSDHF